MTPWFTNDSRVAALKGAADGWRGTPFFANSCAKGGGVSCQFLAAALYREVGFADLSPPEADMAHAQFSPDSLVEPWVDSQPCFESVGKVPLMPGDLVGFRLGKAVHHCGVMLGTGAFIHSIEGRGVITSPIADATWRGRLVRVWRPIE